MEEIIEIFADSISSFIMLSIKLQETNAAPADAMKPAAGGVAQAASVLVTIAAEKAVKEYADFEEIQADMQDCCKRVTNAVDKLTPSVQVLFSSPDRAAGWSGMVSATQAIASQTSRLLLVVYGAEHRRLRAAGLALLEETGKHKALARLNDQKLLEQGNVFVEQTNKVSSSLMVFNSYVGARAKEVEGPKAKVLADAVSEFNSLNQDFVNGVNAMLKGINAETRGAVGKTTERVEALTREILDILQPPEELDIFNLIQDLYSKGNQAVLSQPKSLKASLAAGPSSDVSPDDLRREGDELKKKVAPLKAPPPGDSQADEVISNTNVASAKAARYGDLLADFVAADKMPALKGPLSSAHAELGAANEEVVKATNDYLAACDPASVNSVDGKTATLRRGRTGPSPSDKERIRALAKEVVTGTSAVVKAGGDRDALKAGAVKANTALKELEAVVAKVASGADNGKDLTDAAGDIHKAVVATVKSGTEVVKAPDDASAKAAVQQGGGQTARAFKALLDALDKAEGKAPASDPSAARARMLAAAEQVDAVVDKVNDQLFPTSEFKAAPAVVATPENQELIASGEELLRRIAEQRQFPDRTPKETATGATELSQVGDGFAKQLAARAADAKAKQVPVFGEELDDASANIAEANKATHGATNSWLASPDSATASALSGNLDSYEKAVRETLDKLAPKAIAPVTKAVPVTVTPAAIAAQAENTAAAAAALREPEKLAPSQVAQASADTSADADLLSRMLDQHAGAVKVPGVKAALANDAAAVDDARKALDDANASFLASPDDPARRKKLVAAAADMDELSRRVAASVMPLGDVKREPTTVDATVGASPAALANAGRQLVAAEDKLADFEDMSPAAAVAASNDASAKAARFAGGLQAAAAATPNAAMKQLATEGAASVDKAHDKQVEALKAWLADPSPANVAALQSADKELKDTTQAIVDQISAQAKPVEAAAHSGATPTEAAVAAAVAKAKADNEAVPPALATKAPAAAVSDVQAAYTDTDSVVKLLDAMEADPATRPATRARIGAVKAGLIAANTDALGSANEALAAPSASAPAANDKASKASGSVLAALEEVLEAIKPRAQAASGGAGTGAKVSPGDLAALGDQVIAAADKVNGDVDSKAGADAVVRDTEEASALAAKFADAAADLAKADKRPGVADALAKAIPEVNAAQEALVAASNEYAAKPDDAAAGAKAKAAAEHLKDAVRRAVASVRPPVTKAVSSNPEATLVPLDQLRQDAAAVKAAGKDLREFDAKAPAAVAGDASTASAAAMKLADDLEARGKKVRKPKHKKALLDGAKRLRQKNDALVEATEKFLDRPDDADTQDDLRGETDLLLDDVAQLLDSVAPSVSIPARPAPADPTAITPNTLENLGQIVKDGADSLKALAPDASPQELAAEATDELGKAEDFRQALAARATAPGVSPKEAAALKEGDALIAEKEAALAAAVNASLQDPDDAAAEAAVGAACDDLKVAVDTVLGKVRPRVDVSPEGAADASVKPSDMAVSAQDVIDAATKVQGYKDRAPAETKDDVVDASTKASKFASQLAGLAGQSKNADQVAALQRAHDDVAAANEQVVAAANEYFGDPTSKGAQAALDAACDNLKRAVRGGVEAALPRAVLSDVPAPPPTAPNSAGIGDAATAWKKALDPLRTDPAKLAADAVRDAAEDQGRKGGEFLAQAQAVVDKLKADTTPEGKAKVAQAQATLDQLGKARAAMVDDANKLIGDPSSATAAKAVSDGAANIDGLLDSFLKETRPKAVRAREPAFRGLPTGLDDLDAAAEAAKAAARSTAGAAKGTDDDGVASAATEASKKLADFTAQIRAKADETTDMQLKDRLNKCLDKLESDNKKLVSSANDRLAKGSGDAAAVAAVTESTDKTVKDIDETMGKIRDALAPKTFEDAIDDAAMDIQEAADEFASVPGEMKDLALELAELMRKLAEAARTGDRQAIIQHSKAISDIIKKIIAFAKPFALSCRDPKLADVILVATQAIGNFGTQLKILSSVKASSRGPDPAAENQMVCICEGISNSMRQSLYGVSSAKLAQNK